MLPRRRFVSMLTALGVGVPPALMRQSRPEVENYRIDVPPGATLWLLAVFLSDEAVEFSLGAGRDREILRGRFDGQRLQEYSWQNTAATAQQVVVRARVLAHDREVFPEKIQFISDQHVYVAFGRRGIPERTADRRGSYPYHAVVTGFVTYGDTAWHREAG